MSLQVIAVSATNFSLFEEESFDESVILASFLVQHMSR
jgi:hypothetical protein